MTAILSQVFHVKKVLPVLAAFLFVVNTTAHASPTIIDSISSAQLTGVHVKNISSLVVSHGTVWITDNSNLVHQWKHGELPTVFQTGSKQQKFSSLLNIGNDTFTLTDSENNHLLISNKDSWDIISQDGDQEGELGQPTASAFNQDFIYVADTDNDRVSVFSREGLFLFTFGNDEDKTSSDLNLKGIIAIHTDRKGRVYVLDEANGGRVLIYSALGELDTILGKDEFASLQLNSLKLTAMTTRPDGTLILADKKSGHIVEIDWENMKIISSFGTSGKGRGQFQRVRSLALDSDGKLYVADRGNQKIEIFQMDKKDTPWMNLGADNISILPSSVLRSACEISYVYTTEQILCINTSKNEVSLRSHDGVVLKTLETNWHNPIRAAFDSQETFVLDSNGVKVFDNQGAFKFNFGNKGKRDGDISSPSSLTLDKSNVYIADTGNKRIQVFSRNGLFKKSIGHAKDASPQLENPTAISISASNILYVADNKLHQVLSYSPQGKLIKQFGFPAEHIHEFTTIHDVMAAPHNMLYVMVSTPSNPISIWVYQNSTYIYRFSPTQGKAIAGIDKQWNAKANIKKATELRELTSLAQQALNSTVPFELDMTKPNIEALFSPKSGFFGSDNTWIFNPIQYQISPVVALHIGNHERHTFTVLSSPKQVRNISLTGDTQTLEIKWLAESKSFSGYYTIYGREAVSKPFQPIKKTLQTHASIERSAINATEFRIAAFSPLGKKSKLSSIYQDSFWLGYLAFQNSDYNQAYNLLSEATLSNPRHAKAWLYLGNTQMALGDYDTASQSYTKLSKFEGWQQKSIHLQANALMKKEAWLDVKALVDAAETNGSIDAYLYSLSAKALSKMDDVPSAIYYLNQAVALEPTSPTWHLALADANFELGADKEAKAEILTATQLAGKNSQAWVDIARTYANYQLYDDATVAYERALALEPQHVEALPELAQLHLTKGSLTDARSIATRMSVIPELKSTSYYILGQAALAEGKAPQALAMLAKAGQGDPDNANIWLSMANAYAALSKPEREFEYLLKANATDTENFDVHIRLANTCYLKKDYGCAKEHFESATKINTQSIKAHLGLAKADIASGKLIDANKHARLALSIDKTSIPALLTLAEIQSTQGMIPASISTLKRAMSLDKSNMDVHLSLSKAYIDNHMYTEASTTTEQAMLLDIRNPAPLMLNGSIHLAQQSFDKAIASFEKAVALAPDNSEYQLRLNTAYLQKKRVNDAGGNIVGLKLNAPQFSRIFSAAYKQYTDVPVGSLTLTNESGVDYTNVKISLFVKEYMDFPTSTVIERIPAHGEVNVPLLAAFNNRILGIDEDTGVQTEVRAEYYLAGKPHTDTQHNPMTIYGKNAIVWDKLDMVGSFTTPKDDTLAVFIRQLTNAYTPKGGAVNPRVAKAMTVYNALSAYNIKYLVDPNTPYGKLGAAQLDTVQFPRETLRQRSGDCDDLSILLSASLANLGIETAILDVPQHLLMMFNTGVAESRRDTISLNDDALAIIDGKVWIPLEATLIASSFTEAWAEGARKYHRYGKQGKMNIMPLTLAWTSYPPVTLPPADFSLTIPDQNTVGNKIQKEWEILSTKALERQVRPYRIMLALDESNSQAQMQIAVIYARNGLYSHAKAELESIHKNNPDNIAAINNLGNIYYMQQGYQKALAMYQKASAIEPNNANIKVNMAMVHYKMGDAVGAKVLFDEATTIDDQVPNRYEQLAFLLK